MGEGVSLEPRLSVPDFASQLWRKMCETKSGTESLGLRLRRSGKGGGGGKERGKGRGNNFGEPVLLLKR